VSPAFSAEEPETLSHPPDTYKLAFYPRILQLGPGAPKKITLGDLWRFFTGQMPFL